MGDNHPLLEDLHGHFGRHTCLEQGDLGVGLNQELSANGCDLKTLDPLRRPGLDESCQAAGRDPHAHLDRAPKLRLRRKPQIRAVKLDSIDNQPDRKGDVEQVGLHHGRAEGNRV